MKSAQGTLPAAWLLGFLLGSALEKPTAACIYHDIRLLCDSDSVCCVVVIAFVFMQVVHGISSLLLGASNLSCSSSPGRPTQCPGT